MEDRRASADAQPQQTGDRTLECRMDEYLRSVGFYRKKIAKDGSCLFRAVAEQVLHCQSLHTDVRMACVKYLKQNRCTYEQFIEGDFEKYLQNLQDPQSWVGQVEITALSKLYKRDFIIFQQPDEPPVSITENSFPEKVRLCFLNGNHYDSVYPQSFEKSAALCQSILYELLYDRVCGVDRGVLAPCMRGGRGRDRLDSEECKSSEESDLEEDEFWSGEVKEKPPSEMKTRPSHRGRGRGRARDGGREFLSTKVQKSLNPGLYRNVEYDVWLRSKRLQQQQDFRMAAGMQYSVGDKCKVQWNGRFYSAFVRVVSPDNGPVTVFIEELGRQQTVPLLNLRLPSDENWQKVSEKSKRNLAPNNGHTASDWDNRGGRRSGKPAPYSATGGRVNKQHSWPPQSTADQHTAGRGKSRRSDQRSSPVCVLQQEEEESALLELLHKDEHNFPSLGTSPQTVTAVEVPKRGGDKKSSRKKDHQGSVSETDFMEAPQKPATEKQERKVLEEPVQRSSPISLSSSIQTPSPALDPSPVRTQSDVFSSSHSASVTPVSKPPGQTAPVLPTTEPNPDSSQPTQSFSAPAQVTPVIPHNPVQAPASVPDASVKTTPPIQTAPPVFKSAPSLIPAPLQTTAPTVFKSAPSLIPAPVVPPPTPLQTTAPPVFKSAQSLIPAPAVPPSAPLQTTAPPVFKSAQSLIPAPAVPPSAPLQTTAPVSDTPHQTSIAPPTDGGKAPPTIQPTVNIHTAEPAQAPPPATPNTSEPRPHESPASGVACPSPLLYPPLQWSHILQDPLYPGFPQNERGEVETLPPYSLSQQGEDLPQNVNILRFFVNLGIKAYSQPLWPPISYLGPLTQAYQMHRRASSGAPANPTPLTSWQPETPQNLSSTPDVSLESPSHAPDGSVDMRGYPDYPPPIQMQAQARPPLPWSASPGPSYPESYPVQFSSPTCAPLANQIYPSSPAGFHQSFEAMNYGPPSMVQSQESAQRSMNPHFGSLQKLPSFHPLDFKSANIPPYGPVVQPYPIPGDIAGLNPLANGNFGRQNFFQEGVHVAEETNVLHHAYHPEDELQLASVDLRTGQNFYSRAYRSGGRRGQEEQGGYRGRSHRGWKEYSGRGRQDGRRGPRVGLQ